VDATSRRSREAAFDGADGVVAHTPNSRMRLGNMDSEATTPSAPASVAARNLVGGAASPPLEEHLSKLKFKKEGEANGAESLYLDL